MAKEMEMAACPFCGGGAELKNTWTACYWVECQKCCAEGPSSNIHPDYDGEDLSVRREDDPSLHARMAGFARELWDGRTNGVVDAAIHRRDLVATQHSTLVAMEAALLFDAVAHGGGHPVDLSGGSRLRAATEVWWIEGGYGQEDLDAYAAEVETDLLPGLRLRAGEPEAG